MNYEEVIRYLYEKLPMYQRVGAVAFKKDLTNTIKLCHALGNPQNNFKSIHIAGTNGKGSVSHFLSSIFQEAGYKTGLYTSPHLIDFRERIKINGHWIEEEAVVEFVEKIKPIIEEIEPSFFEITVAMAFYYFEQKKVDIAIVETGLGGRLDSTNIITPELSVITNIGYDHMDMLGNTLELIAGEKAGIIKPGIPVVIGEVHPETKPVFEKKAKEVESALFFAQNEWKLNYAKHTDVLELDFLDKNQNSINLQSPLAANYQVSNIRTVLTATSILSNKYSLSIEAIQKGIKNVVSNTGFTGRWQVVHHAPKVVLDCAHNTEGIDAVLEQLKFEKYKQLRIVYGCVKDKNAESILKRMPENARYYFTKPEIMRAAETERLAKIAEDLMLNFKVEEVPTSAYKLALNEASPDDLILITGSVFLVADILKVLINN